MPVDTDVPRGRVLITMFGFAVCSVLAAIVCAIRAKWLGLILFLIIAGILFAIDGRRKAAKRRRDSINQST